VPITISPASQALACSTTMSATHAVRAVKSSVCAGMRAEAAGIPAQTLLFTARTACVADIVVEQARAWEAGLIVIGTSGRREGLGQAVQAAGVIPVRLVVHGVQERESGPGSAHEDVAAAA